MCKDVNKQAKAIEAVYERLNGEVVNRIYRVFAKAIDGGMDSLVSLFAISNGDVGNEFIVHNDGSISFADGGPIWHVTGMGGRGIAAMCGGDYALSL